MEVRIFTLGIVDLIAGGVLFFEQSMLVKVLAIAMLLKGAYTVLNAIQH
jgi:hypothetical protein